MSRVGKRLIQIPKGVDVNVEGQTVTAKGPKGELSVEMPEVIAAAINDDGSIQVSRNGEDRAARSLHGTFRSLIANMLEGVEKGFGRDLQIQGVGYRAQMQGQKLVLQVGYSHSIEYTVPDGITIALPDATNIQIAGPDKQLVGEVSAHIRSFAPPEPYKGKGIRYKGEHVRHKAGKTVA